MVDYFYVYPVSAKYSSCMNQKAFKPRDAPRNHIIYHMYLSFVS